MPNINAALGVAQLEHLDRRLDAKRVLANHYKDAFADLDGVEVLSEPNGCCSNHWLVTLRLSTSDSSSVRLLRDQLLQCSHSEGLLLRPIWTPLHQLPMFDNCSSSSLAVAENQAPRLLNLPSSPQLLEGWTP